ncbi:MAG: FG-GAP repeat protein, partial [Polyangiales bacterium]
TGTTWAQQAKLVAVDGTAGAFFGGSVTVQGAVALVGTASNSSVVGAAYVYAQSGATWTQQQKLTVATADPSFGFSVALDGATLLVGQRDGVGGGPSGTARSGVAHVFTQSGSTWTHARTIAPGDGAASDVFGTSVSLSAGVALVGAPAKTVGTNVNQGAAYVFGAMPTLGASCTLGSHCASGACADGICCTTACTGACNACLASRTGGADGTCAPVSDLSKCAACAVDGDCAYSVAAYCAGTVCTAKAALGAPCTAADQCTSGSCADGVCCDTVCSGTVFGTSYTCQACSAAAKGQGADGTCGFVIDNSDPRVDCPGVSCATGTRFASVCNGKGACRNKVTACASGACNATGSDCAGTASDAGSDVGDAGSDVGVSEASTDAIDEVDVGSEPVDAAADVVDAAADVGDVGSDVAEIGADVAEAGADVVDARIDVAVVSDSATPAPITGQVIPCASDAQCPSTQSHCVDGICCNTACTGNCMTCTLATSPGACVPVPLGIDPHAQCGAPASCISTCDGTGSCTAAFKGTQCAPSVCTDATHGTGPTYCSAVAKQCDTTAATPFDCAPYACAPAFGACFAICSTTNECASGSTCDTTSQHCVAASGGSTGGCAVATTSPGHDPGSDLGALALLALLPIAAIGARRRRSK